MNALNPHAAHAMATAESDERVDSATWQSLLAMRRGAPVAALNPDDALIALYGPLCAQRRQASYAVAHLAQSLDGRIATSAGLSRWLSGQEDLLHTHRMRALADAVVVGANTVAHDDPQLTVRRCAGASPVRVVLDPEGRLDGSQRVFTDPTAPTLVFRAKDRCPVRTSLGFAEIIPLDRTRNGLDPHEIRDELARRGLHWVFIEGGGETVSRFLRAGALDRLQLTVAPVIIGSGRPAISLPEIHDLSQSLRPVTRRFELGQDTLIECVFHG